MAKAHWLADHFDRVEPHFPLVSTELNLDEPLNADLKRILPTHSRVKDRAQLTAEARRFFHTVNASHTPFATISTAPTSATPSNRTM